MYLTNVSFTKMTERKSQIISKAAVLIKKKGFDGTSMRDLARSLDLEASSLYHHIKSKDELLSHICFEMAEAFAIGLAEVNDIYFNAEEKLRMAVQSHIGLLTQYPEKAYIFVNEWRKLNETDLAKFVILRGNYERGIAEIVKNGEDEGLFNEVDRKFAVLTILATINWVVEWYKADGNMSATEIADKLTDFILTGLKK